MGSYASVNIGDYDLFWMKSHVDASIMTIFTEYDKTVAIKKYEDDEENEYSSVVYKTNVKTAKIRLNIMGFNLKTLEYTFKKSKKVSLDTFYEGKGGYKTIKILKKFLDNFSFEQYLASLNKIYINRIDFFSSNASSAVHADVEKIKNEDPFIKFILEKLEYPEDHDDYRFYLRGFLEMVEDSIEIGIDMSQVVEAGYYDESDKVAEDSLSKENKIIIFTEGKYDTHVIRESMHLLYPQYLSYFTFLDIELSNLELGADRIITYLKSFISAGIINKVLVLFDNDAEGVFCKQEISKLKDIPKNFCIKTYPDIEFSKKYPTICPTGIEKLDINGSASSIEVYLCEEVLKNENKLIPIEWRSFNDKVKKYQGSFSKKDKAEIQKRYDAILRQCKKDAKEIKKYNFFNMDILLQSILTAFDDRVL